ncbi:MAG: YeeE/YedE family protein [SAR324 cluster bacterium]|nr:YeeE/YedE family protein [SAR324 cluster bacterium]
MTSISYFSGGGAPRMPIQWAVTGLGALVFLAGGLLLGAGSWKHGLLFLVGGLLGMSLYHAAFGFTGAYRRAILYRDMAGVNAQLLMLGAASLLFAPILAGGNVFGHGVVGALAPLGWQLAVGSFMFGVGMQLGGGCGSGTLFTMGGGNARMAVTLLAFCAGAFWASLHLGWWSTLPRLAPVSLGRELGWVGAVLAQFALLTLIYLALRFWARNAPQRSLLGQEFSWRGLLRGPWPLLLSAALLALLNWAVLLIAGHPWSITWGFTLWAAKAAAAMGWDPASSTFWTSGFQQGALARGVFRDVTSVMDFGIVLGALLAAGLAGKFRPSLKIPPRSLLAALIGGLLLGYGARLAYGCNIGAFFSGVASTSLHGWMWIACALPGNWLGIKLRPLFGLEN